MRKFKNGVPMLGKKACATLGRLIGKGIAFNAGTVAVSLNPKWHRRGKKIEVIRVVCSDEKLFVWFHGYHYRYIEGAGIVPLNLRDKRVIRFYQQIISFKKKGCKNLRKRIVL